MANSNFGIAIVLFTIIIRAGMMPLTVKQSRQMKAMSALQPKLKEIQAKYKSDRQRQSQETMKMYKDNGVNPIGCLGPMFIQMPIFIALYQAIIKTVPSEPENLVVLSKYLYGWLPMVRQSIPIESTFFWLDLAKPDPTVILPILVGASMFLMQKMTTMPAMDERQASTNRMMLWMMPIMFGLFASDLIGPGFPSGLALYWVISNLVGVVIQGFITGWDPLIKLFSFLKFNKSEPAVALAGSAATLIEEEEIYENSEDERENSGGSSRDSVNRVRRKQKRSRNRRNKSR
ncbi:MAG: YidC/Oxa1 family membrane protein insertase [SAR202 cluster bacterium]|nr:YidC/Oxa1 family membrane protein insertase [SAR202 cluster bacterium]|tara:strand:- start:1729 stop:2595 length:867 start_codon:yes stop_codon:yes gene_type:complete